VISRSCTSQAAVAEPLRERAHELLMRALCRSGRPAEAADALEPSAVDLPGAQDGLTALYPARPGRAACAGGAGQQEGQQTGRALQAAEPRAVQSRLPVPVARVCALTYFCTDTDVHLTPAGHEAIAEVVLAAAGYWFGWFAAYSARFHSAK